MRSEATAVIEHTSTGMWPKTAVLRGRGREYFASGPQDAASLKAVTSGTATWTAHGRRFVLSERMHLMLNAGEYSVEIDTPCEETETLCIFFEPGFLEDVGSRFDDEPRTREWRECIEPWHARAWPLLSSLVAHDVARRGFESVPSFTNAFRRRFGAPPSRWRSA